MAIRYDIEDGVVIVRVAEVGYAFLSDALRAAAHDPAARLRMPLLLDVRTEPSSQRFEDVRWRVQIPPDMAEQFGPRWAFLTGTGPVPTGVRRMFAAFSQIEGLEFGMFTDKDAALDWLGERPTSASRRER